MLISRFLLEMRRVVRPLLRSVVACAMVVGFASLAFAQIARVSVSSTGVEGDWQSALSSVSADGRLVAFTSLASKLVANDTNNQWDVFVHDRATGVTTRVSVASDGSQANGSSSGNLSISADGRYVAFASDATNLVSGDVNGQGDVFVHDRATGVTTLVSAASNGSQANSYSYLPSLSADGRYVAFVSPAANLVADDTNGVHDVFVHDRTTGMTTRVSLASDGIPSNDGSDAPSISADGRYVAFTSHATNLVGGDTNGQWDVFVHDRATGITTRCSVASDGTQGNSNSFARSISADGRYVAFDSTASNLVASDTNGVQDVFVHDRMTGVTTRVSVATDDSQSNAASQAGRISADGRYVAFDSDASNLVAGDTNGRRDVFVRDRVDGTTARVNLASDGTQASFPSDSFVSSISADGSYVTFSSNASNLVEDDTNDLPDVFGVQYAGASLPGPFQKTSPVDGATGQSTGLTLTWGTSVGATRYELCLDLTPDTTCDGAWVSTSTMTSWEIGGLTPGVIYSWQVRAVSAGGTTYSDGSASAFHTFSAGAVAPPGAFGKAGPANGAIEPSTSVLLTWGGSGGAAGYELCLNTTLNSTCDGAWTPVGTATSWALSGLTPETIYSWQVRAVSGAGTTEGDSGTWWSFTPQLSVTPTNGDFNGDGKQDLTFQNSDGQVYAWFLNGLSFGSGAWLTQDIVGPDWKIVGTSDLNGDQKADVLWQNQADGAVVLQTYNGTVRTGGQTIPIAPNTPWRIMATGDFDGDGRADMVWQNFDSGQVYIWFMKVGGGGGAEFDSGAYVAQAGNPVTLNPTARTEWRIAGAGDFDGDGQRDLVWRNLTTGALVVWKLNGSALVGSIDYGVVNLAWQLRAVGDYYGDASPDVMWQNTVTGQLYAWVRDNGALMPGTSLGFASLAWTIVGAK